MATGANIPVLEHFEGRIGKLREMRFWSKVDMRGPDECWEWQASRTHNGYGRFKVVSFTTLHSNRAAWTLANRKEPGLLVVRHSCDVPACCNPAHLLLGTVADNNADKIARGRHRSGDMRGEKNPNSSLLDQHVPQIIDMFRRGLNNTQISAHFPVGHALVSRIRTARSWQRQAAACGWPPAIAWVERQDAPEIEAEIARLAA